MNRYIRIGLLLIFLSFIYGCNQQSQSELENDYRNLTSVIYVLEESNRIDFKKIVDYKNASYQLNQIVEIYNILDDYTEVLLQVAGGYNKDGSLLNGRIKGEAQVAFTDLKIEDRLIAKLDSLEDEELKENLANILYPIFNWDQKYLSQHCVSYLYLETIIIQNRLLVFGTEVRINQQRM